MFKNRALSVQFVKTQPGSPEATPVDPSDIAEIVMYHAPHAVKLVGLLYIGKKVVDTACQIAVITAEKRI